MRNKVLLISAIIIASSNSYAGSYLCKGKIEAINQSYEGSISIVSTSIYGDGTGRVICNLNSDWKGVSPATCRGWLSKALSVEARSADLTINYQDSYTSCSEQPTWGGASNPWALW